MFDIGTKIKRAWNTIWNYKVLWIFVFLLALFGSGGGGGGGGGGGSWGTGANSDLNSQMHDMGANMPRWMNEMGTWFETNVVPLFMPDRLASTIIWMVAIIFGFILVVGLLSALVRYPSEVAVLRMVNNYEESGTKVKFKEGWKLGWNKRAFRLWLIDLIVGAPALVVILGLVTGVVIFTTNMIGGESFKQIPGMIGLIILAGFLIFTLSIVMIFVGMWREYISREIAIADAGVGEAFKQGWAILAHHFKTTILTWLVMMGIGIGFGFVLVLALLLLIPVFIILFIPGAVVAAIPGAIAYGIASIFASSFWPWVIAALVAMPFLSLVVGSPVTLISGLYTLFGSSIWTQTYREVKAIETARSMPLPIPPQIP